jgi:hypothetical protein
VAEDEPAPKHVTVGTPEWTVLQLKAQLTHTRRLFAGLNMTLGRAQAFAPIIRQLLDRTIVQLERDTLTDGAAMAELEMYRYVRKQLWPQA